MKYRVYLLNISLFFLIFLPLQAHAQDSPASSLSPGLRLEQAAMCESIEAFAPKNAASVFSLSIGEVLCFTSFSHVPMETVIYHKWYRKDQLSASRRLTLKPPRWATFSRIQFREADKGPWRVDVTDENGNVLRTIRFSITD